MRRAAFLLITAIALALMASSARAMILITADRGGLITDYAERFLSARVTGEQVVIDGACLSACTLVVGMLPRDKICATPKAVLGFHAAWLPTRNRGLTTKMIFLHGRELAEIVPPCRTSVRASAHAGREPHPATRATLVARQVRSQDR
jgi:hypothetical protein